MVSIINERNLGEIIDEIQCDTIEELAVVVSTHYWSPAIFSARKRNIGNLSRLGLLVLDVDNGCSLSDAMERFRSYQHIICTSRNHQKEKHGVVTDRFRVVLFLDKPITNDKDFKCTWSKVQEAHPFIDEACKDSSRFFYPSPNVVSLKADGELVKVIPYVDKVATAPAPVSRAERGELWKSTLEFLALGAPAGTRHHALVRAVGNMREQGYDQAEITSMVSGMTESPNADWTQVGLNPADLKTIERMCKREMKYDFVARPDTEIQASYVRADELLGEAFDYLSDKDKVKGEPTGINGLDRLLGGGFRTGELTVLMAQAKTGKNTLYHQLIYQHLQRGIPFGYASRELNPSSEVIPNLVSIALGLNAWKSEIDDAFKSRAAQVFASWPLFFAPGYGHFDSEDMERWFTDLRTLGVQHFLFDHFHYALEGEDYEATAKLIKKLKTITKELDIHLNLIVQPRSLREGESLSLATLRGGAAIGQALDNLLILERVRGQENISRLTLEVARHKLAKLGKIYLKYDPETTKLEEVAKELVQDVPVPKGISGGPFNKYGRTNYYVE